MSMNTQGFAELKGTRFYYEIAGDGLPLVMLHAGIADSCMWDDQFEFFAHHFRVLRYDLRGYGQTRPVEGTFSHYEDLAALLHYLHIDRAALIGCSKGGSIALDFALSYPQKASALILIGAPPNGYPFTGDPPPQWEEAVAAFREGDLERVSELEVQVWVDGRFRKPGEVAPAIRDKVRAMNLLALRNEKAALGQEQSLVPPAYGRISQVRVPVLVITGALDDPEINAACRLVHEQIAGAQALTIEGTAHLPNMEAPDLFNRRVLAFLQQTL